MDSLCLPGLSIRYKYRFVNELVVSVLCLLLDCQIYLYQVNSNRILCPADEAIFICKHYGQPTIFWRIELTNKLSGDINLNYNFDPAGTIQSLAVSSTYLEAEVLSGNSTYIIASLTVRITLEANFSTIRCSRMHEKLILPNCEFQFMNSQKR